MSIEKDEKYEKTRKYRRMVKSLINRLEAIRETNPEINLDDDINLAKITAEEHWKRYHCINKLNSYDIISLEQISKLACGEIPQTNMEMNDLIWEAFQMGRDYQKSVQN